MVIYCFCIKCHHCHQCHHLFLRACVEPVTLGNKKPPIAGRLLVSFGFFSLTWRCHALYHVKAHSFTIKPPLCLVAAIGGFQPLSIFQHLAEFCFVMVGVNLRFHHHRQDVIHGRVVATGFTQSSKAFGRVVGCGVVVLGLLTAHQNKAVARTMKL